MGIPDVRKEIYRLIDMNNVSRLGGHSSAGRAPAWHAGGQEFESPWLHYYILIIFLIQK